jgi:hypothetical protein
MRTYISDLIPKIQKFSQKLDNLTLLTNQQWVVIDDIDRTKNVYIFRQNNELLISRNGKVEKAKWSYLGNNTLLIDRKDESHLFKHGFFDENILALKIDSKDEYVFLVNETRWHKELNSIENIIEFLNSNYIKKQVRQAMGFGGKTLTSQKKWVKYNCIQGNLEIEVFKTDNFPREGDKAVLNNQYAPNGKYKIAFMHYVHINNGIVSKISLL